jgi:hypothetical protein
MNYPHRRSLITLQWPAAGVLAAIVLTTMMASCSKREETAAPTATLPALQPQAAPAPVAPAAPALRSLANAVVIGASVSDGFDSVSSEVPPTAAAPGKAPGMLGDLGGGARRIRLNDVFGAMANADGTPIKGYGSSMFFMNASGIAESQLRSALADKPTLVIAIDYLFWHAYGAMPEDQRGRLLERGLARLDTILASEAAPVVVIADLPDMRHAIGKMLMASQVPSVESLKVLNDEINAWAKDKPNVVQVRLAGVVSAAMKSGPITFGGRDYTGPASRALLSWDGLHTSSAGLIALATEITIELKARKVIGQAPSIETNPEAILSRIKAYRQRRVAETGRP